MAAQLITRVGQLGLGLAAVGVVNSALYNGKKLLWLHFFFSFSFSHLSYTLIFIINHLIYLHWSRVVIFSFSPSSIISFSSYLVLASSIHPFIYRFFSISVDGGHRAVIFDRFSGIKKFVVGEGTHFFIPWVQKPILFDIRSRPRNVPVVTGSKGMKISISVQSTLLYLSFIHLIFISRFTKCQHYSTYSVPPSTRPVTSHLFYDWCRLWW